MKSNFRHYNELVRKRFDARKADAVFEQRPRPQWLEQLFNSGRGKAVQVEHIWLTLC